MNTPQNKSKSDSQNITLKDYRAPQLAEYGSLQEITQTAGNTMTAQADGGMGSTDKTH